MLCKPLFHFLFTVDNLKSLLSTGQHGAGRSHRWSVRSVDFLFLWGNAAVHRKTSCCSVHIGFGEWSVGKFCFHRASVTVFYALPALWNGEYIWQDSQQWRNPVPETPKHISSSSLRGPQAAASIRPQNKALWLKMKIWFYTYKGILISLWEWGIDLTGGGGYTLQGFMGGILYTAGIILLELWCLYYLLASYNGEKRKWYGGLRLLVPAKWLQHPTKNPLSSSSVLCLCQQRQQLASRISIWYLRIKSAPEILLVRR